jgi:response regulator RpfG family c-di-GMP phosphodiesterase
MPVEEVKAIIQKDSGKHFDPRVVEAFLAMEDLSV